MKRPDCKAFQAELLAGRDYVTPSARSLSLSRLLGRFDSWYYARLIWIVWTGYLRVLTGRYGTSGHARCSFETLRLVEDCGGKVSITGAGRMINRAEPVVFIANHMSMLETFLLPCMLLAYSQAGVITVVKESLLRYPVFGKLLGSTNPISVTRRNARNDLMEVLDKGIVALRGGQSMLVFPQSTRRKEITAEDFNSIGVKLAGRAGVPIVPVAVKTDFQEVGGLLRDFGGIHRERPVRFQFGEPIRVSGNGKAEHAKSVQFIVDTVQSWQKQDPT